jgi:hypothetical protein
VRKFLVFLLLLGAGLYLLYWLDQRARGGGAGEPSEPVPPLPEPSGQVQGFQPGGRSQLTQYDDETKLPLYRIESADTRTEGGVDILTGVTIEFLDPKEMGVVQMRVLAESARARRIESAGGMQPQWEFQFPLEGVRAEALSGMALAPLVFETASARVDVRDPKARRVESDAPFQAHSPELTLAGRGFELDLDAEKLQIRHEGRVSLLRADVSPATFTAGGDGPLEVRRPEGKEGPVTLEAWQGVELAPGGTTPGRLAAQHVLLRALPGSEDAPLVIQGLDADGNVDWTSGEAHFTGQRLSAEFAEVGRVEHARLEGEPRAELALALSTSGLPSVSAEEQRRIVLEGQDALELTWKDGGYEVHTELAPPPPGNPPPRVQDVVTRDFRLQSASPISGWIAEDQRSARFQATGGVLVTSGEASLETGTFEVNVGPDANGAPVLTGTASGGARLEGKLPPVLGEVRPGAPPAPPRTFTLTSPDGLVLERTALGWRVVESTRVEVSLEDPGGFRARAEHVRDFVVPRGSTGELAPGGMRFVANGAVRVDIASGHFGGEELEVLAVSPVPHFLLHGTSASKAFFQGELGEASALDVEVTGDTLHARGDVSGSASFGARAGTGTLRTTFAGDDLTLDRSESPELLPGERLRTLRMQLEGHAQCSIDSGEQTLVVRSAHFSAENRARLVEGNETPLELGSLFIAEGQVHADSMTKESELTVDCDHLEAERTASDVERGLRMLTASGNVRFRAHTAGRSGKRDLDLGGECETLVYDNSNRHGSLEAGPQGRVLLFGRVPGQRGPLRLTADRADFELPEQGAEPIGFQQPAQDARGNVRLLALRPELRMLGLRAHAEHFTADEKSGVTLSGAVRVSGATPANVPFTLDAEEVVLVARRPAEGAAEAPEPERAPGEEAPEHDIVDELDALTARGQVVFHLRDEMCARGDSLSLKRSTGLLRLDGQPATFELGTTHLETEWVEYDPLLQMLVGTGRGKVIERTADSAQTGEDSWTLDFLSISTKIELDSVILVVQEPNFRTAHFESALRASWAILWLNRQGFEDSDRRTELLDGLRQVFEQLRTMPRNTDPSAKLALFRAAKISSLLREVYFEGPVEILSENELLARADAIYLDTTSQHGWLAGSTVNVGGQFLGQRQEKLIIKTKWLRLSSDGSLRADHAMLTFCTFEEPHVSIVTGNLRIDPVLEPGKEHYLFHLEDNRVELYGKLRIPLPTIEFATDEELKPIMPTLSLANSARFGTLFGFAFTRPADKIGSIFDKIVRGGGSSAKPAPQTGEAKAGEAKKPRSKVDANWKVDGSYLGSRGGLVDVGLEIEAKDDYWVDLFMGVALDTGEDKGFVRVDESDRDTLRRWLRSQAYFDRGHSAWTFSLSHQSDAGVQSEFYESQFLRYERSETYLQWRRSHDVDFAQATAKVRIDEFRSDVEELPSLSAYRGRWPLLRFGNLALVHTGDVRAEYLRRRAGSEPHSPFEQGPEFSDVDPDAFGGLDGLGDRDVLRVDTTQALEMPVPLGGGWKLTPFISGQATAWSEGIDESDSPTRLLAEGGARLGNTFWKNAGGGRIHQIAPFVEYRAELDRSDEDGTPVVFDGLDRLVSGDFVRFGARTRLVADPQSAVLDFDLVGNYGSNLSDGRPDGWLPLEVLARFLVEPAGHEFEVFHDGRYDLEQNRTVYSLVSLGTHLGEQWGVQLAHQRGLDSDDQPLFETASVSGLYRWTEKWEFEGRQSFSLLENQGLDTRIGIRRYGHDVVLEMEGSVREGEGTSFGISVKPRFGYHPPRVGYVPW